MIRRALVTAAASILPALAACQGSAPQVAHHDAVVPSLSPKTAVAALSSPSNSDAESADEAADTECVEWVPVSETWDEATGAFHSEYMCAEGGDIARIVTDGVGDMEGNGHYTQTYEMRDGGTIVWTYDYTSSGMTTTYTGSSDDGETYEGTYTYIDETHYTMNETWVTAEGTYVTDGVMDDQGMFVGSSTFDDPSTAASPDYTYAQSVLDDGSFRQEVEESGDGYTSSYDAVFTLDGATSYTFATDLTDTSVNPDYTGAYQYAADGTGSGSYDEGFDDGSLLHVAHVMSADGSYDESWTFDDASTEQAIDQEGSIHYGADGSGSGTITTHVVGGEDEVCSISVAADGTTSIDDCE